MQSLVAKCFVKDKKTQHLFAKKCIYLYYAWTSHHNLWNL